MMKKNPLVIILGISALFFLIFLMVAVSTVARLTSGRSQQRFFNHGDSIGVLELKGVINDSKKMLEQIEGFSEDQSIKGVILRINSPGGAVAPSQEIYDAVKKLGKKKPVYASMGSIAASGGYYIACGAKKIFANAGTLTGSIGVIMQFADLSKLYQWVRVNPYNIKTGKFKDIGSPNREMSTDERALLQELIDNVLGQFRRAVAAARNLPMDKVIELSDGRIYSGEQAKEVKLVDQLGGIEDAVEAVAKEAGIQGKPNLVYGHKRRFFFEKYIGDMDEETDSESSVSGASRFAKVLGQIFGLPLDQALPPAQGAKLIGPLFLMPGA